MAIHKKNDTLLLLNGEGKRKDRKGRSEEKVVGFRSTSLFLASKRKAVTQVGTIEPGG